MMCSKRSKLLLSPVRSLFHLHFQEALLTPWLDETETVFQILRKKKLAFQCIIHFQPFPKKCTLFFLAFVIMLLFFSSLFRLVLIMQDENEDTITGLAAKRYRMIFSNVDSFYLDCGYGAWIGVGNNWCSPYKGT